MKTNLRKKADTIMVKAVVVAIMTLLLMIPIKMIEALIAEREQSRDKVENEVSSKWGNNQLITGPVLILPYEKDLANNKTSIEYAYFLPDNLSVEGDLKPDTLSRTLYQVLVYQSTLHIKGKFAFPDYGKLGIDAEKIKWEDIFIGIGISNRQGMKNKPVLNINGKPLQGELQMSNIDAVGEGLIAKMPVIPTDITDGLSFDFNLALNGSNGLHLVPVGKETHIHLKSAWPTVSFSGEFSPSNRIVNNDGFDAKWDVFDYNWNYSQMWTSGKSDSFSAYSKLGVDMKYPVDQYQMSMRSVKYAIIFIVLTFVVFFLVELLSRKRIHPIQYLLVSAALILFYTLLLSLSEHIGFSLAYLSSAIAVVALVTAYSTTIFRNLKQTAMLGAFLTLLYVYLYIVLQMEDMALLFGSIGLFVALAIVMFVSRKVNWYKNDEGKINDNNDDKEETPPPFIVKVDDNK